MVSAEPLFPDIFTVMEPPLIVVSVTPEQSQRGPFIAYGRRWERVDKSTHEVKIDYRQLVRAYEAALWDEEDDGPRPYRFCPRCGDERLQRAQAMDYAHDRVYYVVECENCGWSDWSE